MTGDGNGLLYLLNNFVTRLAVSHNQPLLINYFQDRYYSDQNPQIQEMQPQNKEKQELMFMYKSGIKASYFGTMTDTKCIQRSKMQIQSIQEQADINVDEKTFRLINNFKRPQDDFQIHRQSGECYLQQSSFFSCLSQRQIYQMSLSNSKLKIIRRDKIVRYVDFSVVSTEIHNKGDYFTITFDGCNGSLYIQPINKNDVERWVSKLEEVRKNTDGCIKKMTYLPSKVSDFYKFEYILNQQFEKHANSGDILLFQSPHSAATVQRFFTNSQYDHVGVVLRNKKNELFVFESTSTVGVGYTPWRHMVKYQWFDLTTKIVWRKLNAEIGPQQISIIEAFVAKTLGKGFELTMDKLFQFKSVLARSAEEQQNKTYFCSELAARLYKELGFFDSQRSSTNYYPVDFTDKVNLKFVKPGVSLASEKIISFDR